MTSSTPKYGYVPTSFPRDPVEINQFAEHIVLGQILTPLIETDASGNLMPGLAKSWTFSEDRKTITFELDRRYKFDNAQPITARDVKFSISRHLDGPSQSKTFLKSLSGIEITEEYTLKVTLSEPNSSIIKALSRDQLGILPDQWNFDPNSSKPYTSSGSYTLEKNNDIWFLKKNPYHPDANNVAVPQWQIISFKTAKYDIPDEVAPDVTLFASDQIVSSFEEKFPSLKDEYEIETIQSFLQTSAWFYPHGQKYASAAARHRIMALMDRLLAISIKDKGYSRSTGVIPSGISGHLSSMPSVPQVELPQNQEITVALVGGYYDFIFDSEGSLEFLRQQGIKINKLYASGPTLSSITKKKPDVIFAAWAGGFNDPDGFLPILSSILQVDAKSYFSQISDVYESARQEGDWSQRAEMFRQFNQTLVQNRYMVPGWKIPTYAITKKGFANTNKNFRYTPRLATVIAE